MKTVKCSKRDLLDLHGLLGKIPKEKSERPEDTHKLMNAYRAIKKNLKDYLDPRADLQKRINEKIREMASERELIQKLGDQIKDASSPEEKVILQARQDTLVAEANKKLEPFNEEDRALVDKLMKAKCEVVFDNEDFLYLETTFRDCSRVIFGFQAPVQGENGKTEDRIDLEAMDKIFAIFESAV